MGFRERSLSVKSTGVLLRNWSNQRVVKFSSLTIIWLLAVLLGSAHIQAEQYKPIGILTALDIELVLLIAKAEKIKTPSIGGVDYHHARLNSVEVVLARAGAYGMLPSATTSILIQNWASAELSALELLAELLTTPRCWMWSFQRTLLCTIVVRREMMGLSGSPAAALKMMEVFRQIRN